MLSNRDLLLGFGLGLALGVVVGVVLMRSLVLAVLSAPPVYL